MLKNLRFVGHCLRSAAENMAVDEALMNSLASPGSPPVLRFYGWKPHSMSFGYFQTVDRIVDPIKAAAAGIGLVRRMTGGKMVFHADELTFFLAFPMATIQSSSPESQTFLSRFRLLVEPFVTALRSAGLNAGLNARFASDAEQGRSTGSRVHCYQTAAGHSIYLGGRKLIGAAGVSRAGVFAVHGSIPIRRVDIPGDIFRDPRHAREGNDLRMALLEEHFSADDIADFPGHVAECCAQAWKLEIQSSRLSLTEQQKVDLLVKRRYSRLDWKLCDPIFLG